MWIPDGNTIPHWINGKLIVSETLEQCWQNHAPASNRPLGIAYEASTTLCEQAISSSHTAFKSWKQFSVTERAEFLRSLANLILSHSHELSYWETLDTGRPIREIKSYDIPSAAACLKYYSALIESEAGEFFRNKGSFGYVERVPYGVCAGIGAWNYPLQIATWKIAPALAAGNTVIFKPSEWTPLSTLMLASLAKDAGLPDGTLQVLQGKSSVGQRLIKHPLVRKVSLTGSVSTGKKIASAAGLELKPATMELGGKSPLIICDDADLESALNIAMQANFYSNGEICSNGTRVYVHEKLYSEFLNKLIPRVKEIKIGDPLDPNTQMGSLIHKEHRQNVLEWIVAAQKEGAHKLCGGDDPFKENKLEFSQGAFITPVVLADCHDQMSCVQNEIFGPVMTVLKFSSDDEVIQRANNITYGLAAGVISKDLVRGQRLCDEIEAGICWLNTYNDTPLNIPFGGMKLSGLGRENGRAGLESYSQVKSVIVANEPFVNVFE